MRIEVDVTEPELHALEDLCTCIPLCDRHVKVINIDEAPKNCKACREVERKWSGKALHLWVKLMDGYLEAQKEARRKRESR